MMQIKKVFLASSAELVEDRRSFAAMISRKNDEWVDKGVYVKLAAWENFLDAMAPGGLQQAYNQAIRDCELFVMLFWTKVGKYTEEEFDTAVGQFQANSKPFVFTYYKDAPPPPGASPDPSLAAFQAKLKALKHYQTCYTNTEGLLHHFSGQLDKLVAAGFIEFKPDPADWPLPAVPQFTGTLDGSGAIAQGNGVTAVGAGGVFVGGANSGTINTGTLDQSGGGTIVTGNVNTGGGAFVGRDRVTTTTTIHSGLSGDDLESLFTVLLAEVLRQASPARQAEAAGQVRALKAEAGKGKDADDGVLARIVNGLADLVPGAVGELAGLFASPVLQGIAGPVTKIILEELKGG